MGVLHMSGDIGPHRHAPAYEVPTCTRRLAAPCPWRATGARRARRVIGARRPSGSRQAGGATVGGRHRRPATGPPRALALPMKTQWAPAKIRGMSCGQTCRPRTGPRRSFRAMAMEQAGPPQTDVAGPSCAPSHLPSRRHQQCQGPQTPGAHEPSAGATGDRWVGRVSIRIRR